MAKSKFIGVVLLVSIGLVSCVHEPLVESPPVQIAFLADVHLLDVYGELSDSDYQGVLNLENGEYAIARTMQSQLHSTRLFNENYFAFLAALDDVVRRGIRYVVLPGDFSDDGQPLNIRGLRRILEDYRKNNGIEFILTTGNHDPVRPFTLESGKTDFLGEGGRPQVIASKADLYDGIDPHGLPVVVTSDIRKLGYVDILEDLGAFGFFPQERYIYWETPFTEYDYKDYDFDEALLHSDIDKRKYSVATGFEVPDVSYLLEPEEGIWFLAIDANVYVPNGGEGAADPESYSGSSIGYNNVLSHKEHLFEWVESIMERAEDLGKEVIVFSHYPMVEFNDGASEHIEKLMGAGKMQLHRVPSELVAKKFSEAGVRVHFGGHMHINDTGVKDFDGGLGLVNVQIPSLAAYIPAYKIATLSGKRMDIETVVIDEIPRFRELFPLYEMEYEYLSSVDPQSAWNREILDSKNYKEFTQWHLKELMRLRFLANDWPLEIKEYLLETKGSDLLQLSGITLEDRDSTSFSWTGSDMIFDFYRLRSADELAFPDIGIERIREYEIVIDGLLKMDQSSGEGVELKENLKEFAHIFHHFLNGAPANEFTIDVSSGQILE